MANKKISELDSYTLSNNLNSELNALGTDILLPIVLDGDTKENKKVTLNSIFSIILLYVLAAITTGILNYIANNSEYGGNSGGESGSGGSGGGIQPSTGYVTTETYSTQVTSYNNLLNSIIGRLNNLENPLNWPMHTITLNSGTDSVNYRLQTAPGADQGAKININTASIDLPDLYVTVAISTISTSNNVVSVDASVDIMNTANNGLMALNGATITSVELFGSVGRGSTVLSEIRGSVTLESQNVLLPTTNNQLANADTIQIRFGTGSILALHANVSANVDTVILWCRINGTTNGVNGTATSSEYAYYNNGTARAGNSFMTLTSNAS